VSGGAQDVRIGEDGGRAALLVNGIVQSISPEDGQTDGGYWAAMVPDDRPRRGLILGLGGGTLVRLLHARWGAFPIVGIDDDPTIVSMATEAGWLPRESLDVVIDDAFAYVQGCKERFDYIAVDLFRGEELAQRAFGKPFLRRLRVLLVPRGRIAINLFSDIRMFTRVSRIATFFEIREQRGVGGNLVIHAQRRAGQRRSLSN
jgi:spermidine synthase